MSVRAKFKCQSKIIHGEGESQFAALNFQAVYGDGKENKEWSKYTPSGNLTMSVTNPAAFGWFEEGKEYYLDFTEAAPA